MQVDCQVCLSEKNETEVVRCQCDFQACKECYMTYSIPACMKCHVQFTKQFTQKFGIVPIFKAYHQKLTWERECSLLHSTQPFLDWEDTVIRLKKRIRFGERVIFPEKPKMLLSTSTTNPIFACPSSECRGFVAGSHCGVCKKEVCTKCREFSVPGTKLHAQDENAEPQRSQAKNSIYSNTNADRDKKKSQKHECDPELLSSIQSIERESKSCPRCRAQIYRMEGCNHMFCTNCRTHFDWESGRVLTSSSNHHYDLTVAFSKNVAMLKNSAIENTEQCNTDPLNDAIPSSVISNSISGLQDGNNLFRALWKEPVSARYLMRKRLSGFETEFQYQEALLRIRMQYLRKQITEAQAKARVLQEDEKHDKMFRQRSLLEMYLNGCNDLQRMVYVQQTSDQVAEALSIYKNLIDTCQSASRDTRNELGGECLEFSCDFTSQLPHVTL